MNCIVIDDEPLAREKLRMLISKDVTLNLMGCFGNPGTAAEFLSLNPVELVFLDIQMPGFNGVEFAKEINPDILVIFTTAYTEYATDSYQVNAIDYLVKPIHQERFFKAVQKAREYLDLLQTRKLYAAGPPAVDQDFIFLKSDRRYHKVNYQDCLYIESMKDYSILHLDGKKMILSMNIKNVHELLPQDLFIRVSRSYVVNFSKITSIGNNDLIINGQEIMIGNVYKEGLFKHFLRREE